jgi:hypothetical protein
MMPAATTRQSQARKLALRKPMNARSLQMMVSSGVVRRADCTPSLLPNRRDLALPTVTDKVQVQDAPPAQGWLVRLLGRRRSAVSL